MAAAPHLCRPVEFLFPAYRRQSPSLLKLSVGVALYDALALWRPPVKSRRVDRRRAARAGAAAAAGRPGRRAQLRRLPDRRHPPGAGERARRRARRRAGAVADRGRQRPARGGGHVHRLARPRSARPASRWTIRAPARWSTPPVRSPTPSAAARRALRPTLGVHLVVDGRRLPTGGRAFVITSPRDRRVMFVLPDGLRTVVGTTDTDFQPQPGRPVGPDDDIRARGSDVAYLLEAANHAFPGAALKPAGRAVHLRRPAARCWPATPTAPRPPRASTPSGWTTAGC